MAANPDPDYDCDYYSGVYWHGTTVGWIAETGFRLGRIQFGETCSRQKFIWLHANQHSARNQSETSISAHQRRLAAGMPDPFLRKACGAAKYVYRVKIMPFAIQLDLWQEFLDPVMTERVLKAITKTSLEVERVPLLSRLCGISRRKNLLKEPHGWFKWMHETLGFHRLDGQDNERLRRLVLFCKNAGIDVIKHPKAGYHENGSQQHNDPDNAAEWAIMNFHRRVTDVKTGKTKIKRTYEIVGFYSVWPR